MRHVEGQGRHSPQGQRNRESEEVGIVRVQLTKKCKARLLKSTSNNISEDILQSPMGMSVSVSAIHMLVT